MATDDETRGPSGAVPRVGLLEAPRHGLSPLRAYGSAFFLGDESWALTTRVFAAGTRNEAFLLGSGLTISLTWLGATIAGHSLGGLLRDPAQWGLDFASTAVFAALLVG